jgi:4-hydroxythreonine-4-phosphate dehydrogenase
MTHLKRIVLTPGEPAGIGPDIIIRIAQQTWQAEFVVIANPDLLLQRAQLLGLPLRLIDYNFHQATKIHQPGTLVCLPVELAGRVIPGQLNTAHSAYVIQTLDIAASLCKQQEAHAVVTGPVHKGIINQAGIPFSGHTEFFSQVCGHVFTVMLFVLDHLKVALLTTHLPLKEVPQAITEKRLTMTVSLIQNELKQRFGISSPRLFVCGLNPHAGENGYLGREEIDIIIPTLNKLRILDQFITGPLSADTIFTPKYITQADTILAMYHDQALPLIKYMGFGHAVNVTLGLPFIRTSVDHGTALDLAGTPHADASSLAAAIRLAMTLQNSEC